MGSDERDLHRWEYVCWNIAKKLAHDCQHCANLCALWEDKRFFSGCGGPGLFSGPAGTECSLVATVQLYSFRGSVKMASRDSDTAARSIAQVEGV